MEHFLFFSIVSTAITLISLFAAAPQAPPQLVANLETDTTEAQSQSVEEDLISTQRELAIPHLSETKRIPAARAQTA